jgi:hypothetical protein
MNISSVRGMRALVACAGLVTFTVTFTGCAAGDDPSGPTSTSATSTAAGSHAGPDEGARVQAFLDSLYARGDVRHEFTSKAGQAIDCVDFAAEPGVRKLLSQGLTLERIRGADTLPEHVRQYNATAKLNDWYLPGGPDEQGRARECPDGTTPHVRVTEADIAGVGGLDAYLARGHKTAPRAAQAPGGPSLTGQQGYQWVQSQFNVSNTGGTSTMTIADPTIQPEVQDHSIEQVWVGGGSGAAFQSVEVGWNVDDNVNLDLQPHLFTYSTNSAYAEGTHGLTCYNGFTDTFCPDWIPVVGSPFYPGMSLASYVSTQGGTPQHELKVDVEHRVATVAVGRTIAYEPIGWQIFVAIDGGPLTAIGYYPYADYNSGALSAGWATDFDIGAEVFDWTDYFVEFNPNVQMGEGSLGLQLDQLPNPPTGHAAYQRNFEYYSAQYSLGLSWAPVSTGETTPVNLVGTSGAAATCTSACVYDAFPSSTAAAESSTWTNWFYFADATGTPRFQL